MSKAYYVYIITNHKNTVFYIGVTNNIARRMHEHRHKLIAGFSKKYNLKKLVYVEEMPDVRDAICREKQLKSWHREWKMNLIRDSNPDLDDLYDQLI